MRFIIGGEGALDYFQRMTYDGVIGLFYKDTLGGILSYLIFGIVAILAIIGLICVLKFFFVGRKPKESAHDRWLRTGKM